MIYIIDMNIINNNIDWNYLKYDIVNCAKDQIKKSKEYNRQILELEINEKNFGKFLNLLSDDITSFTTLHSICNFMQAVSDDIEDRKKCNIADLMLSKYINELNLNKLLYNKINKFYNESKSKLNTEDNFFLDFIIKSYHRNGINLNENNINLLLKVKNEITNY